MVGRLTDVHGKHGDFPLTVSPLHPPLSCLYAEQSCLRYNGTSSVGVIGMPHLAYWHDLFIKDALTFRRNPSSTGVEAFLA